MIVASRYHDFSAGHRVAGHENKCAHLHGHNYRIHFDVHAPDLDGVGRVMDFSIIKSLLCQWLEDNWDHRMLLWEDDPKLDMLLGCAGPHGSFLDDIVTVPFNPTAENMARYLVEVVGPRQLQGTGCTLIRCRVEETRKCGAEYVSGH